MVLSQVREIEQVSLKFHVALRGPLLDYGMDFALDVLVIGRNISVIYNSWRRERVDGFCFK